MIVPVATRTTASEAPMHAPLAALRCTLALVALVPVLTACPGSTVPGLEPGGEFHLDPSCTLTGTLAVEIGEGTGGFAPLAQDAAPQIHYGQQGGQHMLVGVRVEGLALDRYDTLRTEIAWFEAEQCPNLGAPCSGEARSRNEWVLGDVTPLEIVGDDAVEQGDLAVVLEPVGNIVLQVEVEDPCGRLGLAQLRANI